MYLVYILHNNENKIDSILHLECYRNFFSFQIIPAPSKAFLHWYCSLWQYEILECAQEKGEGPSTVKKVIQLERHFK